WTIQVLYDTLARRYAILHNIRVEVGREVSREVREEVVRIETKSDEESEINRILNELYVAIAVAEKQVPGNRDWGVLNQLGARVKDIFNKNKLNRKAAILTARFIRVILHDRMDPAGNAEAIRCLNLFLDAKK